MNRSFASLLLAVALSGCATFKPSELAQVRARGVSSQVVSKLDRGRALGPADVAELTSRGVPDRLIILQLEDHGVDSLISRSDVIGLRGVGVRAAVIDAMVKASDEFEADHRYSSGGGSGAYDNGPYFYDPYPWHGGIGASFEVPVHGRHRHYRNDW